MIFVGEGKTRIPVRSLWFLLVYASDMLRQLRAPEREAILAGDRDNDLLDAIAEVLVDEVERRLRQQLTFHYRARSADLTRMRGRIDHLRNATRRLTDRGRIACRFEELSIDSPRNRFIAATLLLAARIVERPDLKRRCFAGAFRMHRFGVSANEPSRTQLSTDRLGHHDAADRRMLDAAQLVHDMAIPVQQAGPHEMPKLRQDAHAHRELFEKAVRGFFTHKLPHEWTVQAPHLKWSAVEGSDVEYLPVMKTDTVLDNHTAGRRIVIETKFTDALVDHHGKTTIDSGYLYQLYAYLMSQTGCGNTTHEHADGVLLFVKVDGRDVIDRTVTIQGHRIRFLSVDLSEEPAKIRERWLRCVDS